MTPEEWEQVGHIYQAAQELDEAERTGFLAKACGVNPALRREVESLFLAEQEAHEFLEAGALQDVAHRLVVAARSMLGRSLGQYQLLSVLGIGGTGEVYRARDGRLGRDAAVKVLHAELAADCERLRRFEREAQTASSLNHPNIVTIYEVGEADQCHFVAMELVAGETVRTIIGKRPSLHDAVSICSQIAKALHVAHAADIVHRDIKPENIMLRADGYVKVLDFGLARLLRAGPAAPPVSEHASSLTHPGMLLGTLRYMSPEQARGEHITAATDIFSLGIVLFELATGQHPFPAKSAFETLQSILSLGPLPPSRLKEAISPAFESLLLRMLEKDPHRRPSAIEIEQILSQVAEERKGAAEAVVPHSSAHMVGRKREHAQLVSAWESVAAGHGRLLYISGEPGIGKTTLAEGFLTELVQAGRLGRIARGRCSERLTGAEAYGPFFEALEFLQSQAEAISALMRRLAPTWYWQVVSSGAARAEYQEIERAYSQERLRRELYNFLRQVCQQQPLVLFFDDLHWADASTVDLLAYLADRLDGLRLLILVACRPTDQVLTKHPFLQLKRNLQAHGVMHEMKLDFLSPKEVEDYLALVFPGHDLPPEFPPLSYAKTEGNPLFMVDLVRYLRECDVIAREEGIWKLKQRLPDIERHLPESVRGMIEYKMAQLAEQDHRLLAAASVQGYEFDSAVMARALTLDEREVEERLEVLENVYAFVRLIEEREFPARTPALRYRFTHVLYQNEFYTALGPARRSALSGAVAEAVLTLYGDRKDAVALEVARLFETARAFLPAAEYYLLAARNVSRIFAAREAAALARQGLSVLSSLPENRERQERELPLQLALGIALLAQLGYSAREVEQTYSRARELCLQLGTTPHLLPTLYGLWVFYLCRTEHKQALDLGEKALTYAQDQRSPALTVCYRMLGCPLFYTGKLTQAYGHFQQAISLFDPAQHRPLTWLYGQEPGITTHTYLAWASWLLGYPDQALRHSEQAFRLGREAQHALSMGQALFFCGALHHFRREWTQVRGLADELITLAKEQELVFWLAAGHALHGWAVAEAGEIDTGIGEIRAGVDKLTSIGLQLNQSYLRSLLAEAYAKGEQITTALAVLDDSLQLANRNEERFWEAELHRLRGELLLKQGHGFAESEACFVHAAEIANEQKGKITGIAGPHKPVPAAPARKQSGRSRRRTRHRVQLVHGRKYHRRSAKGSRLAYERLCIAVIPPDFNSLELPPIQAHSHRQLPSDISQLSIASFAILPCRNVKTSK